MVMSSPLFFKVIRIFLVHETPFSKNTVWLRCAMKLIFQIDTKVEHILNQPPCEIVIFTK